MKHMIIIVMISLFLIGCSEQGVEEVLFQSLIPPEEVSAMVMFDGLLYAGGVNGLYVIDTQKHELVNSFEEEFSMVKDLLVYEGVLYIGHDMGLSVYDGGEFSSVMDAGTKLDDTRVNAVLIDEQGRIWIGTYKGVYLLEDGVWTHIGSRDHLLHDTIFALHQDEEGGIWIGHYASPKGGISYVKDDLWQYFTVDTGLPHNNVTGFLEHDDQIYVSLGFYSEGGIGIFEYVNDLPQLKETITTQWGKNGSKVRSLSIHREWYWVGTEYDGLYLTNGQNGQLLSADSGLLNSEVKAMVFLEEEIWLGTRHGIYYGSYDDIYDRILVEENS